MKCSLDTVGSHDKMIGIRKLDTFRKRKEVHNEILPVSN